jgi:hypothetical protein
MTLDVGTGYGEPRTQNRAQEPRRGTTSPPSTDRTHIDSEPSNQDTRKANWVEKGTLFILGLTFVAAAYAGCEAKRLADLTDLLIVDAKDTAKRQLRAHVLYDSATFAIRNKNAAITIRFKNSGNTPAYETTYWWNVKAFGPTEAGKLEFPDTERSSLDIGSQGFLDVDDKEIPLSDIEEARKGNKIIYIWGLVKYRDVFQRCQLGSFALRSGSKIDPDKWVLRGFTSGSTSVTDYQDEHCNKNGNGKSIDTASTIYIPPR